MSKEKNTEGIPSPFIPRAEANHVTRMISPEDIKKIKEILGSEALFLIILKKGEHTCEDPNCKAGVTPLIAMEGFGVPDLVLILEKATAEFKKLISTLMGGNAPK